MFVPSLLTERTISSLVGDLGTFVKNRLTIITKGWLWTPVYSLYLSLSLHEHHSTLITVALKQVLNFKKCKSFNSAFFQDCFDYFGSITYSYEFNGQFLSFSKKKKRIWDFDRKWKSASCVQLIATPWTVARQALLSMEFSRQEYWSGEPFPSPGDPLDPGIEPGSPTLQADSLPSEPPGKPGILLVIVWSLHPLWECCHLRDIQCFDP